MNLSMGHRYRLTCAANLAITIESKPDQFGGVVSFGRGQIARG
jgi:hypothetical protein